MNMYTVTKYVNKNSVRLSYYKTIQGTVSLEGFHKFLLDMIPGPHCAAEPFQVYLLSSTARWNSDRQSAAVIGEKERTVFTHHQSYIA